MAEERIEKIADKLLADAKAVQGCGLYEDIGALSAVDAKAAWNAAGAKAKQEFDSSHKFPRLEFESLESNGETNLYARSFGTHSGQSLIQVLHLFEANQAVDKSGVSKHFETQVDCFDKKK